MACRLAAKSDDPVAMAEVMTGMTETPTTNPELVGWMIGVPQDYSGKCQKHAPDFRSPFQ